MEYTREIYDDYPYSNGCTLLQQVPMVDIVKAYNHPAGRWLIVISWVRMKRGDVLSMRYSRTCAIKMQLFSLSRGKYHRFLNLSVPWKSVGNCHEVDTQNGGARIDIQERE